MSIDNRLLDCDSKPEIEENFNRVLDIINNVKHIEIFVSDDSTATSIPSGATYTKLLLGADAQSDKANGITYNAENGNITALTAGTYFITATFSSKLATTDVIWDTAIFINDEIADNLHMRRRFSTSGYTFNVCLSGLVTLSANDVLDIRSKHNNASAVSITIEFANINMHKITQS